MTSSLAILTWNRRACLDTFLASLKPFPELKIAVFEDCGSRDDTRDWIRENSDYVGECLEFDAEKYSRNNVEFYLGNRNLGVSGNSNRAIKWAYDTGADHLLIANDDLVATGPFFKEYAAAHFQTGIGLFCFNDFWEMETHKWVEIVYRGMRLKLFTQMTGICMSMSRQVVEAIGYIDPRMGRFGQEHCLYTNKARIAGFLECDAHPQSCLDLAQVSLKHQDVPSSIRSSDKPALDALSDDSLEKIMIEMFRSGEIYTPFSLQPLQYASGDKTCGLNTRWMQGYKRIEAPVG